MNTHRFKTPNAAFAGLASVIAKSVGTLVLGACVASGAAFSAETEAKEPEKAVETTKEAPVKAEKKIEVDDKAAAKELNPNEKRDPFQVMAVMIRKVKKANGPNLVEVAATQLPVIRMTGVMEVEGQRMATVAIDGVGSIVLQKGMTYAFLKGDAEGRPKFMPATGKKAGSKDDDLESKVVHFTVKEIGANSLVLVTMDGVEVNINME